MISIIEEKEDIINSSIKKGLEVEEEIEERMMGPSVQLSGHRSEIYCTKFSDCGTLLGSGGKDKDIFIWSVFSARFENSVVIKGHINSILDMCWSWDSEQIFSCGADRTVCIWDVQQATRIKKYRGHESFVNSIAVVRRGPEQLLSASDDCTVRMWDSRIRDQVHQIRRSYQITAVSFSHNSDGFFYAGVDNQIKFYNLRTNQDEYALIGHTDTITDIQLSHSGNFLLSNAMDHTVKAWDVRPFVEQQNRCVKTFIGGAHNFERNLLRCCWSHDDSYIAAGSSDRFAYIWDFDSTLIAHKLGGHTGSVNQTHFHPTKNIIASGSSDRTIFVGEISL